MSERIETTVPLTYIFCILMGWFGPNASMLGGIQLSIWQHGAITDLNEFLANLSLFVVVDFTNFIINFIILRTTVKINILETLKSIQKDFWLVMAFQEAALFIEVSIGSFISVFSVTDLSVNISLGMWFPARRMLAGLGGSRKFLLNF